MLRNDGRALSAKSNSSSMAPTVSIVRIGAKPTADDSEVGGVGEDNKVITVEKLVAY